MSTLLVVHHSPTPATRALHDAVLVGAAVPDVAHVRVVVREALAATADDVAACDALLLGTPANFGYMSGALKHFFDAHFLALGGSLDDGAAGRPGGEGASRTGRLPWALWVHGRYDLTGAVRAVESIAGALPWRRAAPVLEVLGEVGPAQRAAAEELGSTLAALADASAYADPS